MNIQEIERLLAKFYEGTTTLEEENTLRAFFSGSTIPEHLHLDALQFQAMRAASLEELPNANFEEAFFAKVEPVQPPVIPIYRNRILFVTSIAASLLILVVFALNLVKEKKVHKTQEVAFTSQETSFLATCEVLSRVSDGFNKGLTEMQHLQQFDKAMHKVQPIANFFKYESLIINSDQIQH